MILDNPREFKAVDKGGMLKHLLGLPEALVEAYTTSNRLTLPREIRIGRVNMVYEEPDNIVVCGMGGSAIGGLLLQCWLKDVLEVPLEIVRDYRLPAYAGRRTLALVVSYSGNTEEALSCFVEALRRGCMTVAITSDGILKRYAEKLGVPTYVAPAGMPPRAAIAYLSIPLAVIIEKLGARLQLKEQVEETWKVLNKMRSEIGPESPSLENPAKQLALKLRGKLPVIYAYTDYYAAAFRFKTQLNENSKYPAKCEEMPELNHNEIVGWELSGEIGRKSLVIFLIGGDEPPEIKLRFEVTKDIIREKVSEIVEIHGKGTSRLARLFSLIYFGDMVSYYLAILNGVDPTPVPQIERLKGELSKRGAALRRIEQEYQKLFEGR